MKNVFNKDVCTGQRVSSTALVLDLQLANYSFVNRQAFAFDTGRLLGKLGDKVPLGMGDRSQISVRARVEATIELVVNFSGTNMRDGRVLPTLSLGPGTVLEAHADVLFHGDLQVKA